MMGNVIIQIDVTRHDRHCDVVITLLARIGLGLNITLSNTNHHLVVWKRKEKTHFVLFQLEHWQRHF
jgi:hypothetical protein